MLEVGKDNRIIANVEATWFPLVVKHLTAFIGAFIYKPTVKEVTFADKESTLTPGSVSTNELQT